MTATKGLRVSATAALLWTALLAAPGPLAAPDDAAKPEKTEKAAKPSKAEELRTQRQAIDAMASEALDRLFAELPAARSLLGQAQGYAVFDNAKFAFFLSGGGGAGVAVGRPDGTRTYMKMGTAGIGVGVGGQKYQIIFMFETRDGFARFVNKGWTADAGATAVAGKSGANAVTTFNDGIAVFQLTEKGLLLQADIAGTKYWKHKKLN